MTVRLPMFGARVQRDQIYRLPLRKELPAFMSRGAAGNVLESLKANEGFCDMTRQGIVESAS